jgi:predicted permease
MLPLRRLKSIVQSLFRQDELDRDLDEELLSFLELLTEEKVRAGMSREEARRAARLELGHVGRVKEGVRERRLGAAINTFLQDARYTIRTLGKNTGFAGVAIIILATGIGATTALFSTIDTVQRQSVPFDEPDRLVVVQKTRDGIPRFAVSRLDYFDYRALSESFVELAALADLTLRQTITGGSEPRQIDVAYVTWNLFRTLHVNPVVGRSFLSEEEAQGGAGSVLISHRFWRSEFGGASDAVASTINLDGTPLVVVGVMPSGFRFMFDADVWRLIDRDGPFDRTRDSHSHLVVGRLKPGIGIEEAQGEADAIASGLERQYPVTNEAKGLWLTDLAGFIVQDVRPRLVLLMAITVLVLLIACANVAGLLLARGQQRLSELVLRSALGASRMRLIRQLVTESLVLTVVAGLLGIGLAYVLQGVLVQLFPTDLHIDRPTTNSTALLFAFTVSVATGLVVGVVPALRSTSVHAAQHLRSSRLTATGVRSSRLHSGLVAAQVATSITLLIGSGLLIRSLMQLSSVELGFDPDNLLTGRIQIQATEYPTPHESGQFFTSLLEDVEALPSVVSAAMITNVPILDPWRDWGIEPADEPELAGSTAMARWVTAGYFRTMGIPILSGRDILQSDDAASAAVVLLSEKVARAMFRGANPVGRMVRIGVGIGGDDSKHHLVIGVVADARVNTLRGEPDPAMYMSSAQAGLRDMGVVVRASGDPAMIVKSIDGLLRRRDRSSVFAEPASMASIVSQQLAEFQLVILSLVLASAVAVALTAVGLYGVLTFHVTQRMNEIGIRLAVGASSSDVVTMIVMKGCGLVGIGLVAGLFGALPATLLIRHLLFEIRPLDPVSYAAAVGVLALVAALISFMPAWRATQVDVVDVLRRE